MQPSASPKPVVWLVPYFQQAGKRLVVVYEHSSADRQVLGFCYVSYLYVIHATCGAEEGSITSMEPDGITWDRVHGSKAAASAHT